MRPPEHVSVTAYRPQCLTMAPDRKFTPQERAMLCTDTFTRLDVGRCDLCGA